MKKASKKSLLFVIGLFLILDGILSFIFGHMCLNTCTNNNYIGDTVRIIRCIIGGYLIYESS
jgi:hypothetical protein